MRQETTISKNEKENNVTIILELRGEYEKELKKEIKKAIRNWNHLLGRELSYKLIVFAGESNHRKESRQK